MDQMQSTIEALRVSLTEVTTEVISLRTSATASAAQIATLTATSNAAWEGLTARADQTESDVTDVQGHVRRGGGPSDGGGQRFEREWDLQMKGDLKEFSGDKKMYRQWAQQVQAFCNTKRPGFRKALIWASRLKGPVLPADLIATQWDHIDAPTRSCSTC
jgi:hypothetical protein